MYRTFLKRPFDFILALFAMIIASPVIIIIAVTVRICHGSPIIFRQPRPGLHGKTFMLYKFRTMTSQKDEEGKLLPDELRLTKFGIFLRNTSLDELPELINILRGDMSIVGPRPLLVKYMDRYNKEQKHRHDVRPGLTGLAQINGRNAIGWEEKFKLDIKYVNHIEFITDVKIIALTVIKIIRQEGINSNNAATMEEFLGSSNINCDSVRSFFMTLGIYGTGGLGREILIHAKQINHSEKRWDKIIFIDDNAKSDYVEDIEVLSFEDVKKQYSNQSIEMVIAVGEPGSRRFLRDKLLDAGYTLAILVHPNVFIPENTVIGAGTIVRTNCFISCNITIGENVLIQPNASVGHNNVIGNDTVISTYVCVAGGCNIGYETYIGIQVPIKENMNIGNQTIISMGSVVTRDIPDLVIAVGNPARPMRNNEEHKVFK